MRIRRLQHALALSELAPLGTPAPTAEPEVALGPDLRLEHGLTPWPTRLPTPAPTAWPVCSRTFFRLIDSSRRRVFRDIQAFAYLVLCCGNT